MYALLLVSLIQCMFMVYYLEKTDQNIYKATRAYTKLHIDKARGAFKRIAIGMIQTTLLDQQVPLPNEVRPPLCIPKVPPSYDAGPPLPAQEALPFAMDI